MKKTILGFGILCVFCVAAPRSLAIIDTDFQTSPQALKNSGYSAATSKIIEETTRDPYFVEVKNKESKTFFEKTKNCVKKTFMYLDPGLSRDDFGHHDIKPTPSIDDL